MERSLQELDALLTSLESASKITEQRSVCKNIQNWLFEERNRVALSSAPGDSDVSWKALVTEILSLVEQSGKVQKFHIDLLRDCLQGARQISGCGTFPQADRVCKHICSVLQDESNAYKSEYNVMFVQLIKSQLFRASLTGTNLRKLMDLSLHQIRRCVESPDLHDSRQDSARREMMVHLESLASITRELYRDDQLAAGFVANVFDTLEDVGAALQNGQALGERTLLTTRLVECITELLVHYALDFQERAARLVRSIADLVGMSWGQGLDLLKIGFVQCLRIAVAAGIDLESRVMSNAFDRVKHEISVFRCKEGITESRYRLSKEGFYLMDLCAEMVMLRVQMKVENDGCAVSDLTSQPSAKRARVETTLDWLISSAFGQPVDRPRPSIPWMQFICLLLSKDPTALNKLAMEATDQVTFLHELFGRLEAVLSTPLDDTTLVWAAKCLAAIISGKLLETQKSQMNLLPVLRVCLEVIKSRAKRVDGVVATSALLRVFRLALAHRRIAGIELFTENGDTVWQILVSLWSGSSVFTTRGNAAGISENDTAQEEVLSWTAEVLKNFSLSGLKALGRQECPRDYLLTLVLNRARACCENVGRAKKFVHVILAVMCGSPSSLSQDSSIPSHGNGNCLLEMGDEGIDGSQLFQDSRKRIFGFSSRVDADSYTWRIDDEDDDTRFERMLDGLRSVSKMSNQSVKTNGEGAAVIVDQICRPASRILISASEVDRMRSTLIQFLTVRNIDVEGLPSQATPTTDETRVILLVGIMKSASMFAEDGISLLDSLRQIIMAMARQDSSASAASSQEVSLNIWPMIDVLNDQTLPGHSKLLHLSKLDFLTSSLASLYTNDGFAAIRSAIKSFLLEVCRACTNLWQCELSSIQGTDDDGFGARDHQRLETEFSLKVEPLALYLKIFLSGYLEDYQGEMVSDVSSFFCCDSTDTVNGLKTLVRKLEVLSISYSHPHFDEIYSGAVERLMPNKKSDDFKHQRKLIVLNAIRALASHLNTRSDFEQAKLDAVFASIGVILDKYLDAHTALISSQPPKQLQRDIRRILCRTLGQVLSAIKQPNAVYVQYILNCLNDNAFEVRHEAVVACPTFFSTWDSPTPIMGQILEKLPSNSDVTQKSKAVILTHIQALTKIGSLSEQYSNNVVEGHSIYLLCEFYHRFPALKRQIVQALLTIAESSGLERGEIIKMHIHSILCKWIWGGRHWNTFPFALAGFQSLAEFVRSSVAKALVTEYILFDQEIVGGAVVDTQSRLDEIALNSGVSHWPDLHAETYPTAMACILHLCSPPSSVCKDDADPHFRDRECYDSLMRRALHASGNISLHFEGYQGPAHLIDGVLVSVLDILIFGLQLAACRNFDARENYISTVEEMENAVLFSIQKLATDLRLDPRRLLLGNQSQQGKSGTNKFARSDRMQLLLLHCRRYLNGSPKIGVKSRSLAAVRTLINYNLVGELSETSWLFHHVVNMLLQAATLQPGISQEAVAILGQILRNCLKSNPDPLREGSLLTRTICALIPLAQREAADENNVFIEIINMLAEEFRLSNEVHLLPFPSDSIFASAVQLCTQSLDEHTFEAFLQNFTSSDEHLSVIIKETYLSHLLNFLQSSDFVARILPQLRISCPDTARMLLKKLLDMAQQVSSTSNAELMKTKHLLGRCFAHCFAELLPIQTQLMCDTNWNLPEPNVGSGGSARRGLKLPDQLSLFKAGTTIVKVLKNYVETEESFAVAEAASDLLKDIFSPQSAIRDELSATDSGLDKHIQEFLVPYTSDNNSTKVGLHHVDLQGHIDDQNLWLCESHYDAWICHLTEALCLHHSHHFLWPRCARLCKLKASFAELVFPHLLFEIFLSSRNAGQTLLRSKISNAIQNYVLGPVNTDISAIRIVVRAFEFFNAFRCNMIAYQGSPFANEVLGWNPCYWFEISYLTAARAAMRCRAPLTALLFLERMSSEGTFSETCSKMDVFSGRNEIEELMMEAYQVIDESDGNAAFDKGLDLASVASAYERDEEWWRALSLFDVCMMDKCTVTKDMEPRLFKALHNSGFAYLSSTVASSSHSVGSIRSEVYLEASWRAEKWGQSLASTALQDVFDPAPSHSLARFHHSIHQILSLCSFRSFNDPNLRRYLDQARLAALEGVGRSALQSTRSVLPSMVGLRMVEDISSTLDCLLEDSQGFDVRLERQLDCWEMWYRSMMQNEFKYLEPAIALHTILLKLVGSHRIREKHYCLVAKFSMKCNNLSYARVALHKLQELTETGRDGSNIPGWWIWAAKLYWRDGKRDRASALLNKLQEHLEEPGRELGKEVLARVLALNAAWWATTRSKGWLEISGNFKKSVGIRENADCRSKLASFMDSLYSAEQGQADELKKQMKDLEKQRKELNEISLIAQSENEKEIKKAWNMRHKYLSFHETNLKERVLNKKTFLLSALENYLLCIDSAKKAGPAVFRVLHLWFEGHAEDDVNETVLNGLRGLSSCKAFLIIVPQIISRLDQKRSTYQEAVHYLVTQLLQEAPEELLFHLIAAKNEEKAQGHIKSCNVSMTVNMNKVQAAKDILQGLEKPRDTESAKLLAQTAQLIDAYIELADLRQESCEHGANYPLTGKLKQIKWTQQTSRVTVPTFNAGVADVNIPKVASFTGWTYPGGITKPKKISCWSTDGLEYFQIVKGGEDPRADSITSQLFCVINLLLRGNRACRKRALEVRTYKVIPLHPQAGLIEWVTDAPSLGSVLGVTTNQAAYSQSLHGRYDPGGWKHKEIVEKMTAAQNTSTKGKSVKAPGNHKLECRRVLEEVFANTRPVFRHYFFDRSSTAPGWFQRRLTYTRSVAASSIAGFVVGLGDRHTNNILVLERTGEVVHIDLGIVFDQQRLTSLACGGTQGRLLPMPELIPFRLTRDIVDGMGVAGTTGVFSRCCEETLHVLRENRQALLAVVDVLMHDPLTSWKMSANKKASAQRQSWGGGAGGEGGRTPGKKGPTSPVPAGSSGSGELEDEAGGMNVDASFVRSRVREKLEGWDRGELLSVEGQVRKLICDAQSMDNLSLLFRGWSAWM